MRELGHKGGVRRGYWEFTPIGSRDWARYRLENDLPDYGNQFDGKAQIEQRESHEPSFSVGFLTSFQFKRHWAVQSGISYSNIAIAIEPQKIYAASDAGGLVAYKYNLSSSYAYVKPNFGPTPVIGDSLLVTSAQNNIQYIILPIILRYKIQKGKLSISPGFGISGNFLFGANVNTEAVDGFNRETLTINKLDGTHEFYLGFMANADIQFHLNRNWAIDLMPGYNCALSPITKNGIVKTYPYSFSFAIGASISLKTISKNPDF